MNRTVFSAFNGQDRLDIAVVEDGKIRYQNVPKGWVGPEDFWTEWWDRADFSWKLIDSTGEEYSDISRLLDEILEVGDAHAL